MDNFMRGPMPLSFRLATVADIDELAELNARLIEDEGHRNPLTPAELKHRMREWVESTYSAVLFNRDASTAAYALYCEGDQFGERFIFLRQFFVKPEFRRQGIGRAAIRILYDEIWPPNSRVALDVLCHNSAGRAFWEAMGFREYSMTVVNRHW
jgi:GNAT superfamily N-acetyltransferase